MGSIASASGAQDGFGRPFVLAAYAVQFFFGGWFFYNGLNYFLHFTPAPPGSSPLSRELIGALEHTGLFAVVKAVELGAGASTLIAAKALSLHGGGRLTSFDQHGGFVDATRAWLTDHGLKADLRHAPLTAESEDWPGRWYALDNLPDRIDLLIIDGPPWSVHPLVRGAADSGALLEHGFWPGGRGRAGADAADGRADSHAPAQGIRQEISLTAFSCPLPRT